jgi:hypothetical protein
LPERRKRSERRVRWMEEIYDVMGEKSLKEGQ